jgi:hypothetical protein
MSEAMADRPAQAEQTMEMARRPEERPTLSRMRPLNPYWLLHILERDGWEDMLQWAPHPDGFQGQNSVWKKDIDIIIRVGYGFRNA